jgi:hypothetical protein
VASIHWRLLFRLHDRGAVDRCLAKVSLLFGNGVQVGECKPYWKDPGLWECSIVSPAAVGSVADQVFGCPMVAQSLANGWYVIGSMSTESANGFSGVFAVGQGSRASRVVGLEWASFDLVCAPAE